MVKEGGRVFNLDLAWEGMGWDFFFAWFVELYSSTLAWFLHFFFYGFGLDANKSIIH
jgi:hypothetical protein